MWIMDLSAIFLFFCMFLNPNNLLKSIQRFWPSAISRFTNPQLTTASAFMPVTSKVNLNPPDFMRPSSTSHQDYRMRNRQILLLLISHPIILLRCRQRSHEIRGIWIQFWSGRHKGTCSCWLRVGKPRNGRGRWCKIVELTSSSAT